MKILTNGLAVAALCLSMSALLWAAEAERQDEYQKAKGFGVDINGSSSGSSQVSGGTAHFKSVGGISLEQDSAGYQEGGVKSGGKTITGPKGGANPHWRRRHSSSETQNRQRRRNDTHENRQRRRPDEPDRHKPLHHPSAGGRDFGQLKSDGNKIGDPKFGGGTDRGKPKSSQLSPTLKNLARNGQGAGAVTLNGIGKQPPGPPQSKGLGIQPPGPPNSPAQGSVNPGPPGLKGNPSQLSGPTGFTGGVKPR